MLKIKRLCAGCLAFLTLIVFSACGAGIDVSGKIYLGSSDTYENQETAEAALTAKGIPYTVTDAGTRGYNLLASVNAEFITGKGVQTGYYINKGETAVLKVYTYEKPATAAPTENASANPTESPNDEPDDEPNDEPTEYYSPSSESGVAYLEFLREYEAWVDEYVEFMAKFAANPTDLTILTEYVDMLTNMAEWSDRAAEWDEDVTEEELVEYLEIYTRILEKLASIEYWEN